MKRLLVLACVVTGIFSPPAFAASFDHTLFEQFLAVHVRNGAPDLLKIKEDQSQLDLYLSEATRISRETYETFTREEKMAFLINFLNAVTLRELAVHYPAKTAKAVIEEDSVKLNLLDAEYSRAEIETELLRKRFRDERVFAALYRGSRGGPRLRGSAYSAENIDQYLDEDVRAFVNDPSKNRITPRKRKIFLSSLLKTYAADFILNYGDARNAGDLGVLDSAVLSFVANYADPDKKPYLEEGRFKIKYLPYDWTMDVPANEKI